MKLNHKKKALAIILLFIAPAIAFAQNRHTIDSLKRIINHTTKDTAIIHMYLNLSCEYQNFNLDTALYYTDLVLNKLLKINYKKGIADAYRQKGGITIYLTSWRGFAIRAL